LKIEGLLSEMASLDGSSAQLRPRGCLITPVGKAGPQGLPAAVGARRKRDGTCKETYNEMPGTAEDGLPGQHYNLLKSLF